jgi:hypothetical protein
LAREERAVADARLASEILTGALAVGSAATTVANGLSHLGSAAPMSPDGTLKTDLTVSDASKLVDGLIATGTAKVTALAAERADIAKRLDGTMTVTVETFKGVTLTKP